VIALAERWESSSLIVLATRVSRDGICKQLDHAAPAGWLKQSKTRRSKILPIQVTPALFITALRMLIDLLDPPRFDSIPV
jgi:hypothetical protein